MATRRIRKTPGSEVPPINHEELLDLASEAVFVRDPEGRIHYWNRGAERVYGFTRAEAVGRKSHELLHTVFPVPRSEIEARVRADGEWRGELLHTRRDGAQIAMESYWALRPAADAKFSVLEINSDVTERREAERKRAAVEANFRALVESAPDAIIMVDGQGRIRLVNRQVETLFGYVAEELLGEPVEKLMPAEYRERHVRHRQGFTQAPHTRPMGTGMELLGRRKSGEDFPVEISLSPVGTGDGLQVAAVIRDVSERKRNEAATRRLHTLQLAEAEHLATLGEIAAGMAHEIRNPLAGIRAALDIIAPGIAVADAGDVVAEMQSQVSRILRVVNELLHYARPQPMELIAGNLNRTIESVAQFLGMQAQSRSVTVEFEPGDLPPVVHDSEQIHRLVANLGLNALQAVADGGRVVIATRYDAAQSAALIEVRDNGAGIGPGDLEKIFRPFFSTKGGKGTGLGLSLCRRIAELHGGAISVTSAPGQGSAFTVALPPGARPGREASSHSA